MTKEEYNNLISMIESTDEDFELAKGIIENKFNDPILIRMLMMNCKTRLQRMLNTFHRESNLVVEDIYKDIMNAPDKYKYFYLFEYCVEKRVNELLSIARYNSFIDKVSITLIDG